MDQLYGCPRYQIKAAQVAYGIAEQDKDRLDRHSAAFEYQLQWEKSSRHGYILQVQGGKGTESA